MQEDAARVEVVHYSNTSGLSALDGKKHGTNHRGAEFKRLDRADAKRFAPLHKRVYFYVSGTPQARGESVVGREAVYGQTLENLYDIGKDRRDYKGSFDHVKNDHDWFNEIELAIVKDGFDGWVNEGVAAVLGTKPVPVREPKFSKPRREAPNTSKRNILFSQPRSEKPFYSALVRSIEEANGAPKRANLDAWSQWLDGAQRRGEIKRAKREWLGSVCARSVQQHHATHSGDGMHALDDAFEILGHWQVLAREEGRQSRIGALEVDQDGAGVVQLVAAADEQRGPVRPIEMREVGALAAAPVRELFIGRDRIRLGFGGAVGAVGDDLCNRFAELGEDRRLVRVTAIFETVVGVHLRLMGFELGGPSP